MNALLKLILRSEMGLVNTLQTVLDRKERTHKERLLARYVVDSMNTHNVWALKMLFIEFLNLVCIQCDHGGQRLPGATTELPTGNERN